MLFEHCVRLKASEQERVVGWLPLKTRPRMTDEHKSEYRKDW